MRHMTRDPHRTKATDGGHVTRAIEVVLDPSPSQQRRLRSYAGSMRAAYNWALAEVRGTTSRSERASVTVACPRMR